MKPNRLDSSKLYRVCAGLVLSFLLTAVVAACGSSSSGDAVGNMNLPASAPTSSATSGSDPSGMNASSSTTLTSSQGTANANTVINAGITITIQQGAETSSPAGYVRVE